MSVLSKVTQLESGRTRMKLGLLASNLILTKPQAIRKERLPNMQIRETETQIRKRLGGCLPSRVVIYVMHGTGANVYVCTRANTHTHTHTHTEATAPLIYVLRERLKPFRVMVMKQSHCQEHKQQTFKTIFQTVKECWLASYAKPSLLPFQSLHVHSQPGLLSTAHISQ